MTLKYITIKILLKLIQLVEQKGKRASTMILELNRQDTKWLRFHVPYYMQNKIYK